MELSSSSNVVSTICAQVSEEIVLDRVAVNHKAAFLHRLLLELLTVLPLQLLLALKIQYFVYGHPSQSQLLLIFCVLAHTHTHTLSLLTDSINS